jgi:rhamnosyltransferase
LAFNLPKDTFEIYVACEKSLKSEAIHIPGVRLVYFPVFDKFRMVSGWVYDILSLIWSSLMDIDIVYLVGYSAGPFCVIPRIMGKTTIVNVDGLEWKRASFSKFERVLLKKMEMLTVKAANYILCDSQVIQSYYLKNYKVDSFFLPNPVPLVYSADCNLLKKFGLKKNGYYLVVCRLEPENNIDLIIDGFRKSKSLRTLVIVGTLTNTRYVRELLKKKNEHVIFLGSLYDKETLETLRSFCFAYIHGHEVGGTSPTLVQSLACSSAIVSLDVPFNREVALDAAVYFKKDAEEVARRIDELELNTERVQLMRRKAIERVKCSYSREIVLTAYENMFKSHRSERIK